MTWLWPLHNFIKKNINLTSGLDQTLLTKSEFYDNVMLCLPYLKSMHKNTIPSYAEGYESPPRKLPPPSPENKIF